MINENNLYVRICKFGNEFPKGFTYEQIKTGLEIGEDDWESKIIKDYMLNALRSGQLDTLITVGGCDYVVNPSLDSMFFAIARVKNESDVNGHTFILKYDSFFNYVDYLELKAAFASSETAKKQARYALIVSASLALASIVISIFSICVQIKGDINIDKNQLKSILEHIDSTKLKTLEYSVENKQFEILLKHIDSIRKSNNKQRSK
jgi:hypothetical protein